MQGLEEFISTEKKIQYVNQLLRVGFDTIDFGSFVSPKSIPQMRDTGDVLKGLDTPTKSKLLAIVANIRGATDAAAFDQVTYLGFPLSLSETFQRRNTNKSISDALSTLQEIKSICERTNKKLVTYISMGFGNPYNDPYSVDLVVGFVDILKTLGSDVISVADTIGVSTKESIKHIFTLLSNQYPDLEIGAHLHSTPQTSLEKIEAAFQSGCKRFDGAIRGFGGCPMAKDELVGNLATENIISYLEYHNVKTGLDMEEFAKAVKIADEIFQKH
jgi:hydroxymethylglutaryl-CoA lyase